MKISLSPQEFCEILISHHPDHPVFDDDVVRIRGRRVCAGCMFAYPVAALTLILLQPTGFGAIIISIILAALSQIRQILQNRHAGFVLRIVAGIALGYGIGGFYWAVTVGNITAILLIIISGIGYGLIRYFAMRKEIRSLVDIKTEKIR